MSAKSKTNGAVCPSILKCLILLAFVIAMTQLTTAQQFFGSIVGTITDTTGAIIPGATVTIVNKATGEKHTAASNGAGGYQFVDLVPATYSVTVERANFKRSVRDSVMVEVNQTVRADAKMQVGAVTETVEVNLATAVQLQTDTGTVSNQVASQQLDELPLNGRNVMQLLNITPGVMSSSAVEQGATLAQNNGTSTNPLSWGGGSGVYTINGGDNEEYIDGAPINVLQGSNIGLMPTADDIQQFNIDTSAGGADEGRATGGVINETTKSGTNRFHGTAYDYFRNADLNANNFFNKRAISATFPNGQPTPKFNQNLYGFNIGFPVKKDKIFFFGSYEVNNSLTQAPTPSNEPCDANATSLANPCTGGSNIYNGVFNRSIADPLSGKTIDGVTDGCVITHNAVAGTWALDPGTYGVGSGCIDPTSQILRTYWAQQPNSTAPGANYFVNMSAGDIAPEMNARMDFIVSPKQRIFAHTAWWAPLDKKVIPYPHPDVASGLPGGAPWNLNFTVGGFNSNMYILGDTYTFNSKTVMDIRAEYLRFRYTMVAPTGTWDMSQLGTKTATNNYSQFLAYIPQGQRHLPSPNITSGQSGSIENLAPNNFPFGFSTGGTGQIWDNYGLNGSLTRVAGKHSLKMGFEARLMDMEVLPSGFNSGNPSFGINYSGNSNNGTGDEWAELLMGYYNGFSINGSLFGTEFNWYQAYFVQDTWQASRKLTVTIGLRWELPGGLMEKKNSTYVGNFFQTDPNTKARGTETLVPTSGGARSIFPIKHDLFDPRFGFAYRLDDKTVIRGGFGISTQAVDEDGGGNGAPGVSINNQTLGFTNPTGGSNVPTHLLQNPIPSSVISSVYVPRLGRSQPNFLEIYGQAAQLSGGTGLGGFDQSQRLPYFEQYNFGVQRAIRSSFLVTASYVGSHGVELKTGGNIDQIEPSQYVVSTTGVIQPQTQNGVAGLYTQGNMYPVQTAVSTAGATNVNGLNLAGQTLTSNISNTQTVNGVANQSGVFCTPGLTTTGAYSGGSPGSTFPGVSYHGYCNNNVKVGRALQPYPNYSSASIGNLAYGNQHYNALQMTTQWRIPGGGLIGSAFTWAKTIDDTKGQQDYYNHRGDRTVDGVPSRLVVNVNYPLPIGRGQRFLNVSGPLSPVISGCAINDVTSFQHGGYIGISTNSKSQLANNFGAGNTRASYYGGGAIVNNVGGTAVAYNCNNQKVIKGSAVSRLNEWYNIGCFQYPGDYAFGNEPANDPKLFTQGIDNSDIALAKTTKITERLNVQFRAETFNTFNRFQASGPSSNAVGNGNFGKVTSQANNPRQIQLSLRVSY